MIVKKLRIKKTLALMLMSSVLTGLMLSSCKTLPEAGPVATYEHEGTITVRSTGTGSNARRARLDAERQAVYTLLFRGFPDSQQKTPLIGYAENSIPQQHKEYFTWMFGKTELGENRYRTFIIASRLSGRFAGNQQNVDVTINLRALRSDLEQRGIIRKFGY
jgi:hypothetical protein